MDSAAEPELDKVQPAQGHSSYYVILVSDARGGRAMLPAAPEPVDVVPPPSLPATESKGVAACPSVLAWLVASHSYEARY
jgi:hypothetical protein